MRRNLMNLVTALMLIALVSVFGMPMFAKAEAAAHVSHEGHSDAACHDGWTAISNITELMNLFETGGSGYLTADIDMGDNCLELNGNTKVTLCLNGYSIIRKQIGGIAPYTIIIRDNSVFTLYDESENTGKITHVNRDGGTCVHTENNAEFIMNGGTITVNETGDKGIGIDLGPGKFIMNDGIITGHNGRSGVFSEGEITMNGGIISDNTSEYTGGGICVSKGSFTMTGGSISGNKAISGGGVYIINEQNFIFTGGEISNNEAFSSGGGVFSEGSFTMTGGNIKNNSAPNGGGVLAIGTFTMSDGSITCNNAEEGGGIKSGGTFTMDGGIITENNADTSGGGVNSLYGTFTMNNGNILKNNAGNNGGGINLETSVFNMNGGTIAENNADIFGGGVKIYNDSSMTMKGGKILRNEAGDGAGIYSMNSKFTLSGGEISENKAEASGGALYFRNGEFIIKSGTVKNNTAQSGEGIYVESEGKIISGNISDDVLHATAFYTSVTFNPNKGKGNIIRQFMPKSNGTDLYGNGFTRSGYSFVNWNTNEDGTGDSFEDSESMQMLDDLILYAQWKPDKYTVKFDANGGSGTMSSQSIDFDVSTALSNNSYTKKGYAFAGWNTKADGSEISYADGEKVKIDLLNINKVTLYAQWQEAEDTPYKAEHYLQNLDGTYPKEPIETDEYKGTTNSFVTPELKDYEGFTAPAVKTVSVNADGTTVVKYKYKRKTYTLEWDFGGATVEGEYTSGKVKFGAPIKAPVSLSKTGYEFMFWNYDVLPETMPAENIIIRAFWGPQLVNYKVEHYRQRLDGTYSKKPNEVEERMDYVDTEEFVGVREYEGFTSPTPEKATLNVDGSTVVRYYYTRNSYTLTWDFAGGSADEGTYTNRSVKYGEAITKPVPVRAGYTFNGWKTTVPKKMPANNLTIKATWKAATNTKYTVEHYKQKLDGTYTAKPGETDKLTGTTNTKVTPEVKTYEGFTSPATKTAKIKADGTLVVQYYYERNSYTLTWNFTGGTATGSYTEGVVKYGAKIKAPVPTRTGYVFNGWKTEVPKTMPAKNLTIKATWKAAADTKYTVEHYKQKLDGTYNAKASETESLTGTTNTKVTPAVKEYKGFTAPELQTVKISADGTLVVKYYYTRNSYKLTWDFAGGSAKGSYTKGNVKYGAAITAPVPTRDGYAFTGWDKTVASTMPAKDVTYKAKWRKLTQEENVKNFVERFYTIILDRPAEAAGLNDWTNRLIGKTATGADVAAGFINSGEFQKKKMTDEEYVTKLYRAFFDREPDKAGYDGWLKELKNGKSRDFVLRGFINSAEFNTLCKKYGINAGRY